MTDSTRMSRTRRKIKIGGAVLCLAVVVLVAAAYFFPLWRVSSIQVSGAHNADAAAIQTASGIRNGDNFLRLDLDGAAQHARSVPWVKKVTVNREFPANVSITVTEHQAIAQRRTAEGSELIDAQGKVFLRGAEPKGVPRLDRIPQDDPAAVRAAATALAAIPEPLRAQVQSLEAKDAESLELFFPEGKRVYWGSAERAGEKAEATRIVLTRKEPRWNVSNPAVPTTRP